ncbi:MAG: biotin--[acetyl-CoA-carboxylase] ligase [Betaproteobacteria bacterium]|nr:MAG: biotin--[acetyl-CoA-carboxylase] ligase [Betaproteobacteria bacterium]
MLRRLADGEFHSGERLAQALQVSRGSIWNALNEARAAGLDVQRIHGRGYRLREPLDWLDAPGIDAALEPHGLAVRVVDCCESTNADMLIEAEMGVSSGRVLVAEMQTRGRGRLGRRWHSGIASALTFSLLWRFERSVAGLAGLSLAVGVAIARALRIQGIGAELKWPNDLLWQGRKLGGILIEVRGDSLGPCAAVIGVGLNVRLGAAEKQRIDQPAADLSETGMPRRSRTEWLTHVLAELAAVLPRFDAQGFAAVHEEWMRYHAHQGARVCLVMPDGTKLEGEALGVDESACLLIATDHGVESVHAGDVSLRARP